MLTFNLKKEWFEKIKSGEKTHEYREFKNYWRKRITKYFEISELKMIDMMNFNFGVYPHKDCYPIKFKKGYNGEELLAKVKLIRIIKDYKTDLKIDKWVFDIEFELIK